MPGTAEQLISDILHRNEEYKNGYRDGASKCVELIKDGYHVNGLDYWVRRDLKQWIIECELHRPPRPGETER